MKKIIRKFLIKFTLQTPRLLSNVKNNLNLETNCNDSEDKFFLNQKIDNEIIKKLNHKKKQKKLL